ncbi:UNVERIFIED_CONTAM: hypothetical protein FKN15_073098 [Acipenser sinensis]
MMTDLLCRFIKDKLGIALDVVRHFFHLNLKACAFLLAKANLWMFQEKRAGAADTRQQDEERRRQLRERARQLIAEARSGVKMSELPSYNEMAAEKLKERSKAYGGGQNSKHVDLKLKKLLEARPQVVNALSTAAAQKVTNDGTEQEELKETMMDNALRTISYIADIGNIVVLMARRRMPRTASQDCIETTPGAQESKKQYKMICHVFESEDNNAEDNRTERLRKATERLRSPVMFKKDSTVRKTQLQSFSQYVENRPGSNF